MTAVAIRGTTYPVVLPKLRDPRLHLAATITSLQVLGQIAFHFRLSISQILICLGTCAVIEVAITLRKQHVLMWPASGLLTGNGVAFVLRITGMQHGDWWSVRGWWIYVLTAGGSLLSKYVISWRGEHVFNPSNIGLVVCFLALGRSRVEPLDFWWGPMSWWMALALVIIVAGGFAILSRLRLLRVALSFWAAFAVGIGGLALAGHAMTARWHLGPIQGFSFWWVLVTSPEVLVFLFFMITDPRTAPTEPRARVGYGIALGALASLLIAPTRTEFAAKVALLSSLALICVAKALLRAFSVRVGGRQLLLAGAVGAVAYALVVAFVNGPAPSLAAASRPSAALPPITILPSPGVQTQLDHATADTIAHYLVAARPLPDGQTLRLHLEPGSDQSPPTAVAQVGSATYRLHVALDGSWSIAGSSGAAVAAPAPVSTALAGTRLRDVAAAVGLDFRQGSFRFGSSNEAQAMMGGGVCWLDYNGDGWPDLFVVNSYSSADTARWEARGGLPRAALFENVHGRFVNVSRRTHADLVVQGDGCVAADLTGNGRPDLVVTTTSGVDILWNTGSGRFRTTSLPAQGWYTGAAVADVNGDGRPDIFVTGYADTNEPVPYSTGGFPTNVAGVRDLLYLNEGGGRFREVGVQAGLESSRFSHGLGALFTDVNGDGRPDLYVANDEDPNELYVNVPWPGGAKADPERLGFRLEERGAAEKVADPFAGMGIAGADGYLFVTNNRGEPSAAFRQPRAGAFTNARPRFDPALGTGFAGWGATWVDLANSGSPDLFLAAGAIPVTSLSRDAERLRVLAPTKAGSFGAASVLPSGLRLNGRGVAAADADNDGRMEVAVNTIGGTLALLRPSGPSGHWLDVRLSRFTPGAVVSVDLPGGRRLSREVQAGSSYLSSEDPRVHFGLGKAKRVTLLAHYPWGATSAFSFGRVDRVVEVRVPPKPVLADAPVASPRLSGCTTSGVGDRSVARIWNDTAVAVLRAGGASDPVQARDLFELSAAIATAYRRAGATARNETISFAAYRLLLWQASFDANLSQAFGLLTRQLRSLCYSRDFTTTTGRSAAALGNRIAAATIAAGRRDGSNEELHYADPSFTPVNAPLVVSRPVSTPHDPTFWQPLALGQIAPRGAAQIPAEVQTFEDSQWGRVRTFALHGPVDPGPPPLGGARYVQAAVAAIRATAGAKAPRWVDGSPLAWNALAASLPAPNSPPARLRHDVRLDLALNAALNDAGVAAWSAKRAYDAPRPISMIRYLAFNGELPALRGLIKVVGSGARAKTLVRSQGHWVLGARWTSRVETPPSPGWISGESAFAYAAERVLSALTGRSFEARATEASRVGIAEGIYLPADARAGRTVGLRVGSRVLVRVERLLGPG
jgi:FG-GAP-like repeat/ASPIC and UnbV